MSANALSKPFKTLPVLFEDFFSPWDAFFDNGGTLPNRVSIPSANVVESGDAYSLSLAVPGMKKEDFIIDVDGNILTVSSEKEEKKEETEAKYTRKEYSYASFSRSFTLPDEVEKDKINAHYEDGVLKLSLPKKEEAKKLKVSKHITVK